MDGICAAFMAKWGKIPLLDTYRQMAIRQQKIKDWPACKWWAERGLALYGQQAAREEAVEDLIKRRNRAITKLEAAARPESRVRLERTQTAVVSATPSGGVPGRNRPGCRSRSARLPRMQTPLRTHTSPRP
jgi:hypothetical protein